MKRWAATLLLLPLLSGCPDDDEKSGRTSSPVADFLSGSKTQDKTGDPGWGPDEPDHPGTDDSRSQLRVLSEQGKVMNIKVGTVPLKVWLADTPVSRHKGLMHVKRLSERRGMLFVYPEAGRPSFYMKNTYVPLSLAYISADGTIEQIVHMQPLDLESHPSEHLVRFVLEVNQGWFERHGVEVGMTVPGIEDLRGY